MSDAKATKRQLSIKTNVVKRLVKEEKSYIKEAQDQEVKIQKMENEKKDEWEIKKQREVLQDSLQMIPDCKKRLDAAISELENIEEGLDAELKDSEEAKSAQEALELARASKAQ